MMAPGFKPVGWVAAVASAALGCYMLSLNVASERAELARVERQILLTKQQIRALHTELGTRGRLAQLEHWNAEVLALSAPTSQQFLNDEMMLARFDERGPSIDERATLRMASADTGAGQSAVAGVGQAGQAEPEAPATRAAGIDREVIHAAAPHLGPRSMQGLVHRAGLDVAPSKPLAPPRPLASPPRPLGSPPRPAAKVQLASRLTAAPAREAAPLGMKASASPRSSPATPKSAPKPPSTIEAKAPAKAEAKPVKVASRTPAKPPAPAPRAEKNVGKSRSIGGLDDKLVSEISAAARVEARSGGR